MKIVESVLSATLPSLPLMTNITSFMNSLPDKRQLTM